MKKIAAILLIIAMLLTISACRNSEAGPATEEPAKPTESTETSEASKPSAPASDEEPGNAEDAQTPDSDDTPGEAEEADADRPLALSYQTNRYYGMYEEGMKCYVDYPRIRTEDAEKAALSEALLSLDASLYQKAYEAGQTLTELPARDGLYSGEIVQYVTRADEVCLSLLYEMFINDGTEEAEWTYFSHNFDPQTGAELTLDDVFTDSSRLPEMLSGRLQEAYPNVSFQNLWAVLSSGTAWEEQETESSEPAPKFAWTLSYEGVEFYFYPGLIADYEAGAFHVTVRYESEMTAISERFRQIPAAYAELLEHQTGRSLDLNADGAAESLLLEVPAEADAEGWKVKTIDLTVNGEKYEISCPDDTIRVQAYLIRQPHGAFLYAFCTDAAGDDTLLAIALTAEDVSLLQSYEGLSLPVTEQEGAYWTALLTDPSQFLLQTSDGIKEAYCIGADGLLQEIH